MIRRSHLALTGVAAAFLVVVASRAGGQAAGQSESAAVIVHADNPVKALAAKDAANLFLKRTRKWPDGSEVVPIDQVITPVRRAFSVEVLKREADAVASFWLQQVFSGRDVPPQQLADDAAVLAFVRTNVGAIGYISATTPATGVKVVTIEP